MLNPRIGKWVGYPGQSRPLGLPSLQSPRETPLPIQGDFAMCPVALNSFLQTDGSGRLNLQEFHHLWKKIKAWQVGQKKEGGSEEGIDSWV